ncbi:MAG: CPBP family intramembrane metalloprotease [Candidatus Rhabdochlamydia sp.]
MLCALICLYGAILSLWIKKDPRVWATFMIVLALLGGIAGHIHLEGYVLLIVLSLLWIRYHQKRDLSVFIALIALSIGFKLKLLPGFTPFYITPKFAIGLINPLMGLFPLALLTPLVQDKRELKKVFQGVVMGCVGIAFLAALAIISKASVWSVKIPSYAAIRIFSNFVLTAIPEEGFYRGFVQAMLGSYFKKIRGGNLLALLLSSLLFSLSHLYWSPNLGILTFTFVTSLLYGAVYLYSGKIESAILSHFLFNLLHMTCFSYHAM